MTREDKLIRQIQNGSRECLDELVEMYYPAILRYCMWHTPDVESAKDAAQDTFLKLVRFIDRYDHRGQFKAFLYRIAANACTDILRGAQTTETLSEQITDLFFGQDTGYQAVEDRQQLKAAFICLDDSQRELILLRYGQELTLKEISALTGLPLRTVQTRLRRALARMRHALDT